MITQDGHLLVRDRVVVAQRDHLRLALPLRGRNHLVRLPQLLAERILTDRLTDWRAHIKKDHSNTTVQTSGYISTTFSISRPLYYK